jgi:hypothetical protein
MRARSGARASSVRSSPMMRYSASALNRRALAWSGDGGLGLIQQRAQIQRIADECLAQNALQPIVVIRIAMPAARSVSESRWRTRPRTG